MQDHKNTEINQDKSSKCLKIDYNIHIFTDKYVHLLKLPENLLL